MRSRWSLVMFCLCVWVIELPGSADEVKPMAFDVAPEKVDQAVERFAAMDFADVARPAALILVHQKPERFPVGRDPRLSEAEYEASLRRSERPAYTVARLVWQKQTSNAGLPEVARVLGEMATDQHGTEFEVRLLAIDALGNDARARGVLTEAQREPLYRVAIREKDAPTARYRAAEALVYVFARKINSPDEASRYNHVLSKVPEIVRAQPTPMARHAAFNDLTNMGVYMDAMPKDQFASLLRLGFSLIEETPEGELQEAYVTARRLGYMIRRPNEFAPPREAHLDAKGNLAPSYFRDTVKNARQWWTEAGRRALDEVLPPRRIG